MILVFWAYRCCKGYAGGRPLASRLSATTLTRWVRLSLSIEDANGEAWRLKIPRQQVEIVQQRVTF